MSVPLVATRTISQRLADYVFDLRFEDIPAGVVTEAKARIVHHLGVAFRGAASTDRQPYVQIAHDLSGPTGDCSIIGEARRADLAEAVFANSALMGHHGLDDFQLPGGLHIGAVAQPAAWAVGERTGASGRELLVAVVVAYDVAAKLANSVWTWTAALPRRPNSVFAPIGVAATAARLLRLDREQVAGAIGHAAHAGMGLIEGSEFMGILHPLLARNGLMAAMLADAGLQAAPTMIEGEYGLFRSFFGHVPDALDENLSSLGRDFEITKTQTKRYQSSGLNIVPIELMLELVGANGLKPERVARVDVALPVDREGREKVWEDGVLKPDATSVNRAGSLRFQLAIVLADGVIDSTRYDNPLDSEVRGLMDRFHLLFEGGRAKRYARIEITTTAGERLVAEADDHVFAPVDPAAWLGEGGRRFLTVEQLARLAALLEQLEDVADVAEIMACTTPANTPGDLAT